MTAVRRVIVYIDGVSLYQRLKSKQWRHYMWLNPVALSESFFLESFDKGRPDRRDCRVVEVKYFAVRRDEKEEFDRYWRFTEWEKHKKESILKPFFGHRKKMQYE